MTILFSFNIFFFIFYIIYTPSEYMSLDILYYIIYINIPYYKRNFSLQRYNFELCCQTQFNII